MFVVDYIRFGIPTRHDSYVGWTFMSVARPGNAVEVKCIEPQLFCARSTLSGEDSDMNVQTTGIAALDHRYVAGFLPITGGTVAVVHSLRKFLLKRVLANLFFVDCNAEAGPCIRSNDAVFRWHS